MRMFFVVGCVEEVRNHLTSSPGTVKSSFEFLVYAENSWLKACRLAGERSKVFHSDKRLRGVHGYRK
jgi:hypothetical protein